MSGPIYLKRLKKDDSPEERYTLDDETVSFGRTKGTHLLSDEEVSNRHLSVEKGPDPHTLHIQDQNSTNGTFVNGKKIKGSALVKAGDEIRIGKTRFQVEVPEPPQGESEDQPVDLETHPHFRANAPKSKAPEAPPAASSALPSSSSGPSKSPVQKQRRIPPPRVRRRSARNWKPMVLGATAMVLAVFGFHQWHQGSFFADRQPATSDVTASDGEEILDRADLPGAELPLPERQGFCDGGHIRHCWELAHSFLEGEGDVPVDPQQAFHYFEISCQEGVGEACTEIAHVFANPEAGNNPELAIQFYEQGCQLGDPKACEILESL